jgi:hypothetical protein
MFSVLADVALAMHVRARVTAAGAERPEGRYDITQYETKWDRVTQAKDSDGQSAIPMRRLRVVLRRDDLCISTLSGSQRCRRREHRGL